jgi:hypothetical protein
MFAVEVRYHGMLGQMLGMFFTLASPFTRQVQAKAYYYIGSLCKDDFNHLNKMFFGLKSFKLNSFIGLSTT